MKRAPIMRRTRLARWRRAILSPAEHEAAAGWRVKRGERCVVTGATRDLEAHHALERSRLRSIGRPDLIWDLRGRMVLARRIHERHSTATERIPRRFLSAENLELIREALGEYAEDWLAVHYPEAA